MKVKGSRAISKSCVEEDASRATRNSPDQEPDAAAPASAGAASKRLEEERLRAGGEQSKKRKKVMGDKGLVGEENAAMRSKRRCMGDPEAAAVAVVASGSAATEQASSASSAISSPIRQPYVKRAVIEVDSCGEETLESFSNIDPAILDAYEEHHAKYSAKQRSYSKLITLDRVPYCGLKNPYNGTNPDFAAETVLKTAKLVFGLSSYVEGKLLKNASGFIIEWDKESKVATLLTSALLICTKSPSLDEWLAKDEFAPNAEVQVHLLDKGGSIAKAELIHYNEHYNFALFKIKMDLVSQIPSFSTEVKSCQEIFVVGRDKDQYLMVNHGWVMHKGPDGFDRHHDMFTTCEESEDLSLS